MASRLARTLGISPTNITNARTGRLLMPTAWMATIVNLSKRKLSYAVLVEERECHRKAKAKARIESKSSHK
jgi:hypothetical protein